MPVVATQQTIISVPQVQEHQRALIESPARGKCAACGRRWGKTTAGLLVVTVGHGPSIPRGSHPILPNATRLRPGALEGARIWWTAPTYDLGKPLWRGLKQVTRPLWATKRARKNDTERTIEFPSGGSVVIKSADDPGGLVAEGLDGLVIDEAGKVKEDAWRESLRPALMDRLGWWLIIGTPKGMNWFYDTAQEAKEDTDPQRWFFIQKPSWDNPKITTAEVEEARRIMPPFEFAQEIEAQFLVAGRGLFKPEWIKRWRYGADPQGHRTFVLQEPDSGASVEYLVENTPVFLTLDAAVSTKQEADFTVIAAWATTPAHDLLLIDCDRRRMEGPDIIPAMEAMRRRWKASYIAAEHRMLELMLMQMAARQGVPLKGVKVDGDKTARALPATAKMQQGKVWFPQESWGRDLEFELLSFGAGGGHDDFVDAFSLAVHEAYREWETPEFEVFSLEQVNPWRMA